MDCIWQDKDGGRIIIEQVQARTKEDVAKQLVAARKGKHMTQQDVSDLTGIQRANISRMESGRYNPTLDVLVRIAESIGMELEVNLKEKESK